ncbi:hypothetical protein C0991_004160 [Blastosporella zonata]|nr:hypothetical protein C0991_004160 [Blastosporella zonata]
MGVADTAYNALVLINRSSDVFPPLKSASAIAVHIMETIRNFQSNKKDWEEFGEHISRSIQDIHKLTAKLSADREDIKEIMTAFQNNRKDNLTEEMKHSTLHSIRDRIDVMQAKHAKSVFNRFRSFLDDKGLVPPLQKEFDEALKQLYVSDSLQDVTPLRIDVANLVETLDQDRSHKMNRNLQSLLSAEFSAWNADDACLPGTRTALIREIMQSLKSGDPASQICLLSGVAGSGKSTIAHSIAKACSDESILASSFFFKTAQTNRDTPSRLISTFARDLASTDQKLAEDISRTIEDNTAIATTHSISVQFAKLIEAPLQGSPPSDPIVFVIDALDEGWTKELITLLSSQVPRLPSTVRFFVTSRPSADPAWQTFLRSVHVKQRILDIHDKTNESDLNIYVDHRLREIAADPEHDLPHDWPGSTLRAQLSERAGGLFQWARTTCDYIRQSTYPDKKLVDLMANAVGVWTGPEQQMDDIYKTILEGYLWSDNDFVEGYYAVVGSIVAAKAPLSVAALQSLHCQPDHKSLKVKRIVKMLGSLLHDIPDDQKPLEPLHLSLREFLTTTSRVGSEHYIDIPDHNSRLALHCLQLLNQELPKQEITELGYLTKEGVPDGVPVIPRHSVSEAVLYACRFWADHMKELQVGLIRPEYVPILRDFLKNHLVTWLEIVTGVDRYQELLVVKKWITDNQEHVSDSELLAVIFTRPVATCLKNVSRRLSDVSRHDEALLAALEAVEMYRHLVLREKNQRSRYRLTNGLRRLAQCHSALGNRQDALDTMIECVDIWRGLEQDGFPVPCHDFAQALRNLSNCYADLGNMDDALRVIEEAIEVPSTASPGLIPEEIKEANTRAACFHSYTNHLSTVRRSEEALISICKAVDLRREIVAKSDNVNCLEELATSLESLAVQLGADSKAAVEVSEQAVSMRRFLSDGRPTSYTARADLARSLNNYSNNLDRMGEPQVALSAITEAVAIGRDLVADNPTPFDPDLAIMLSNCSNCLTNQDRHKEALDVMLEAVEFHRKMASRYPEIYDENLATALRTLGRCYSVLSDRKDLALASVRESKEIMERVESRKPVGNTIEHGPEDDKIDIVQSSRHPRNRRRPLPLSLLEPVTSQERWRQLSQAILKELEAMFPGEILRKDGRSGLDHVLRSVRL